MKKISFIFVLFLLLASKMLAQGVVSDENVTYRHQEDTVLVATLADVVITAPYIFHNSDEYRQYLKYDRYAAVVYPYAVEAVKVLRQIQKNEQEMGFFERKRNIKQLQKDLKERFEDPLKNLTRTQGKILIKMIERKMDTPIYSIIKDVKGGFVATYWSVMGSFYGYKLREGYIPGEDKIMDYILGKYNLPSDFSDF